ncbi:MAG: four-carbon acid sugar kinase family protein, partial [Propionibacteriaceae bacterium]|nr:four-carbon acid sugar kinase family protein [Propionibacteriaceae bacterium]
MACVLIIGDDLTGSNATGVLYAKAGRRVVTVSSVGLAAAMRNDVDVLVVDTESRHLPPNVAASRVRTVVAAAAQWGVQ